MVGFIFRGLTYRGFRMRTVPLPREASSVRHPFSLLPVLLALALVACGEAPIASPTEIEPGMSIAPVGGGVPTISDEPLVFGEPDASFLRLSERAPAFAGYYVQDGRAHILSTSGQLPQGLTVRTELPLVVREADHSWETLTRWHRRVYETLITSAQSITISERANRIVVATLDHSAARNLLEEAGVPENLYALVETEQITFTQSLTDAFASIPGGVQIHSPEQFLGQGALGTLGFNVDHWLWGGTFVTTSHATYQMFSTDGSPFRQPFAGGLVGTEIFDHPGWTSNCPSGYVCRYSDAALIAYEAGIDHQLGQIARTTGEQSTTIDSSEPRFLIAAERLSVTTGTSLWWVGQVSGRRSGEVVETCTTTNISNLQFTPVPAILWCQHKHSRTPLVGDSGAPVFRPPDPLDGTVRLAGMVWGKATGTFSNNSWFSPLAGIRSELNPNGSLDCDGLATTIYGGCGAPSGGTDDDCDFDDHQAIIECDP